MGDSQIKYNTEITREHYFKYRSNPENEEFFTYFPKISLFHPNDMHMISKTMDGAIFGCFPGFVAGFLNANDEKFSLRQPIKKTLTVLSENMLKHAVPWVIAGTTYGLATSASANYRHKADYINHIIGGLSGGSVFGMWYRNTRMGFWLAVFGGIGAGLIKYSKDNDLEGNLELRKPRVFNMYRRAWFTDPIPVEGTENDEYKYYKP